MFTAIANDRALAELIVKYTKCTAKDLRRLSNIAALAADIKHHEEHGTIPSPPTEG